MADGYGLPATAARIELEADEREGAEMPGMALVGFLLGSAVSLAIWALLGWVAWRLLFCC